MSAVLSNLITELKTLPPFASVPEDQLQWLIDQSDIRTFSVGDRIFEPGIVSEYMSVIIQGRFRIYVSSDGKQREIARVEQGEITGVLPYSRIRSAVAVGEAIEESTVMMTHKDVLKSMIPLHYELTEALVHVMSDRIRNFTTLQQQNEKLMSLGKLSAGLAHELNNPAAALVSTSEELRKQLQYRPEKFKRVIAIKMDDEVIDLINNILWTKANEGPNDNLSLMEKTEREDDLRDWLEDEGLEVDDDMIDNFVDYGFTIEELDEINEAVPDIEIAPVLHWMEQVLSTNRMIGEIKEASSRISELVGSIKDYTHMDRDQDRQLIDIHEGIINTVIMLKHKIKKRTITLDKSFGQDLPKIYAFPGELNQVWTNLIDNALDAMDEQGGTLSIHTSMDGPCLKVCIGDTGKGISPDVLPRIFDPFFTTKAQGKGTGLGLDVVRKIVEHHKADISVTSEPGKTEFVLLFSVE